MQKYNTQTNQQEEFQFEFPLTRKVVQDLKIVKETIGELSVIGSVTPRPGSTLDPIDERFAIEIDFVKWQGQDIKPVLDFAGLMDDIFEAAFRHVSELFTSKKVA